MHIDHARAFEEGTPMNHALNSSTHIEHPRAFEGTPMNHALDSNTHIEHTRRRQACTGVCKINSLVTASSPQVLQLRMLHTVSDNEQGQKRDLMINTIAPFMLREGPPPPSSPLPSNNMALWLAW
jgi:hypothetical protein